MMELRMFLVIDSNVNIKSLRTSRGSGGSIYAYTNQGTLIYPFESPVPIIKRGVGCVGVAVVLETHTTSTKTTVEFTMTEVSAQDGMAYFNLYKNTVGMSNTGNGDVYENAEDMIIPGAMAGMTTQKPISKGNTRNNNRGSSYHPQSLSEIANDMRHDSNIRRNHSGIQPRVSSDYDDDDDY